MLRQHDLSTTSSGPNSMKKSTGSRPAYPNRLEGSSNEALERSWNAAWRRPSTRPSTLRGCLERQGKQSRPSSERHRKQSSSSARPGERNGCWRWPLTGISNGRIGLNPAWHRSRKAAAPRDGSQLGIQERSQPAAEIRETKVASQEAPCAGRFVGGRLGATLIAVW